MDLRYPIGKYVPLEYSENTKEDWISAIRFLPQLVEDALQNLNEEQLHTPYREGGWTVHQVVHHIADSHMNAYIRFKLGYTEPNPTIKPYEEALWAETADSRNLPVNISVTLLFALHRRWHEFLTSFGDKEWKRTVYHPEYKKEITLWHLMGMYAWHGRHHTAHITRLRERQMW